MSEIDDEPTARKPPRAHMRWLPLAYIGASGVLLALGTLQATGVL